MPTRKEAMLRVALLLILAVVAGMLDWQRLWFNTSLQQFPWASFTSNVLKGAASVFVLLPSCKLLSEQQRNKWYERLQSVFKS